MLRWFGHMERMEDDWLVKRVVGSNVKGMKLRERPQTEWMNVVKRLFNEKGMSMEKGKIIV